MTVTKTEARSILLVDDHTVVRRGLTALIEDEPDLRVCGEAEDVPTAMRLVGDEQPDLVIVDLTLKTGHGLDLIQRIRTHGERPLLLVLSMHDEHVYAERVLRAGAQGYLNKNQAADQIIGAIRRVLAGGTFLSPVMTERILHGGRNKGGPTDVAEKLTDRELSVFELIGRGVTTRQIAEQLRLSIKTIETYREQIKAKLGLANAAELSREATRWVLDSEG